MTRVSLIFGGASPEHEVSIVSARFVASTLRESGYEVILAGLTRNGTWVIGEHAFAELCRHPGQSSPSQLEFVAGLSELVAQKPDVAFPLVHGLTGEDGCLQGLFELLDLPYVGGDVLNQSLCFDKIATRQILHRAGLPQPNWISLHKSQDEVQASLQRFVAAYDFPLFVKPSRTGSSIGISKVNSHEELMNAMALAFGFDDRVIVETAIKGQEVEIAGLGGQTPFLSCVGEIVSENAFYDFEEKYIKDSAVFHIPARLNQAQVEIIRDQAERAWRLLHCFGMARIDFLVDDQRVILNEINTIPGFTKISMYPKLLNQSGRTSKEIITELVELAIKRGPKSKQSQSFLSQSDWYKG